MELPLALVVGAIVAGGLYLVMQRNLLRFVFGLILLSGGVNLLLFTAGRPTRGAPPLVPEGAYAPVGAVANALPQALILTAIVIGFGLTVVRPGAAAARLRAPGHADHRRAHGAPRRPATGRRR